MNEQQAKRSFLGLLVSLLVHGLIVGALWWGWQKHEEAANSMPGEISTTISMEMIQGMRMEEPAPEPEPQTEPEPEKQEVVADPTLKPEPEKKKEPEKKPEKPKEKPKPKPKKEVVKPQEKPVEMPKNLPVGDRNVNSQSTVNSKQTTTGQTGNSGQTAGSGASSDEIAAYRSAIRKAIERQKRYPARARMMRKQGVVTIAFNVGGDGSLNGERIAQSSGDESLDNAALEAVKSANAVGPKPAGFPSGLSVPISFTLQ